MASGKKHSNYDKAAYLVALFAAVMVSVPAILGYISATPGHAFTGFEWPDDFGLYASHIKQSADSPKLFTQDLFTTEPQGGVYIFLYFTALGIISWATGIGVPVAFLIGRFIVILLFLAILWKVLKEFFPSEKERLAAFVLASFSGGIGWLALLAGYATPIFSRIKSTDLNYSLGYSSFGHFTFPLPFAAYTLFLLVFLSLLRFFETRRPKYIAAAAILHALIFFVHPASIAVFSLALALVPVIALVRTRNITKPLEYVKAFLPFALSAGIVLAYILWASKDFAYGNSLSAYMAWKRGEPILFFLLGYGILIPLAVYGISKLRAKNEFVKDFLIAWIAAAFLAAANPDKGVKLMFALHLPLAIAASYGLFRFFESVKWLAEKKDLLLPVAILILSLSAPFIISAKISDATNQGFQSGPYISTDDLAAAGFVAKQPNGNVLASYDTGNKIPYLTGQKVFLGHWTETAGSDKKRKIVESFFGGRIPAREELGFLKGNSIKYIFYGENERKLGSFNPAVGLKEIYSSGQTKVYTVE